MTVEKGKLLRTCRRARTQGFLALCCHAVICHRFVGVCQLAAVGFHLRSRTVNGDVAAHRGGTAVLEAQPSEGLPNFLLAQTLGDVAADKLQGHRSRHELSMFLPFGLAEVQADELQFRMLRLERLVMACQAADLVGREPVLEALAVEGVGLRVDALVVERRGTRALVFIPNSRATCPVVLHWYVSRFDSTMPSIIRSR